MTNKIKRNSKIFIRELGMNIYAIEDRDGNLLCNDKDDFFIYFKSVNFLKNGSISGRYLGDNPSSLIDSHVKKVFYDLDKGWVTEEGKVINTAKMVALENKSGVMVIIENS